MEMVDSGGDAGLLALMVRAPDEPGTLHEPTRVILEHNANITYVELAERRQSISTLYFELEGIGGGEAAGELMDDLRGLEIVRSLEQTQPFAGVYGKRIIVIGGGAQVGQVVGGCCRGRSPQHPRRAHLGGYHLAGG